MNASVLLCTCEGAQFLREQLRSLADQSFLDFELVAVDDDSTDETLDILRGFARTAPFPVHVHENEERLGPSRNFERALHLATGEVVFFCDQDDVWAPQKLALMLSRFRARSSLGCLFSDAELVDADGRPLGRTLWSSIGFSAYERARFGAGSFPWLLKRTIAFGATMAVRRDLIEVISPLPLPFGHDNCAAIVAAALTDVALIDRCLGDYRQHGAQVSSVRTGLRSRLFRPPATKSAIVADASSFAALADRIETFGERAVDPALHARWVRELRRKAEHLAVREELAPSLRHRIPPVLTELAQGSYHRYSNGLLSVASDLVRPAFVASPRPTPHPPRSAEKR